MSKYTDDFKLSVINHYLNGSSYHQTAKTFCIDHKQVELWVKLYQVHGIDGVRTRRRQFQRTPVSFGQGVDLSN